MMTEGQSKEQLSEQEARERLEAALRGARAVGPKHKPKVTPKRTKQQANGKAKRSRVDPSSGDDR